MTKDVHDPETRSYNMSRIRGKDTKPEVKLRSLLHREGFRFRIHDSRLPGKRSTQVQIRDFCQWMFLASTRRMQVLHYSCNTQRFLGQEILRYGAAGSNEKATIGGGGMACFYHMGM